jgi:prepilin-type N-terminal cleavage/methylation domain-containing protein
MKTFMKSSSDKWQVTSDKKLGTLPHHASRITHQRGFTLIELLVVISIMALIAAMIFPVAGAVSKLKYVHTAKAELNQIKSALEDYKAKYGVYPPGTVNCAENVLYYEFSGVTHNTGAATYTTLDGACTISEVNYSAAFGVGGIINCTKGGAEDGTTAKNYLPSLKQNRIGASTALGGVPVTNLISSVHGLDPAYQPLGVSDAYPFCYAYPGTNNPSSYDLWIDLKISGKTNRICNWLDNPKIL